jgi:hypothetical protein
MRKWRQFWGLTGPERRLFLLALALLPLNAAAVRLCGLRRWQAVLARLAPLQPKRPESAADNQDNQIESARRLALIIGYAAYNSPFRANCLQRSLALWWALRRRGIESELRIGARREAGQLKAHAWIERDGVPLNDLPDIRDEYAPLAAGQTGRAAPEAARRP